MSAGESGELRQRHDAAARAGVEAQAKGRLGLALQCFEEALEHFERGLDNERIPYRRGQLLLWGSRAADRAGRAPRASAMRIELLAIDCRDLADHHAAARAEEIRPFAGHQIEVSLLLADAQ